jgi:hypothetical protein
MAYEWMKTIKKGVIQLLCFGVPLVITTYLQWYPEAATLTVGTILTMLINYLKNKK